MTLRRAVAEAEFRKRLEIEQLWAMLGRGRPGSRALRRALERHLPELAKTRSRLEERFILLCERFRLPRPLINEKVCGIEVDALFPGTMLIVELDGGPAHASSTRMEADREKELALRAAGYRIVRYTWRQLQDRPREVAADARRQLAAAAA